MQVSRLVLFWLHRKFREIRTFRIFRHIKSIAYQPQHRFMFHRRSDSEDGVVGPVPPRVEGADIVERCLAHMAYVGSYSGPAVGVRLVAQRPEQQPHIAVWLIHVALVILLGHNPLLHLQRLLCQLQALHAVGLEHQSRFQPVGRQSDIVVGVVAVGEGVALATQRAHHAVEVGHAPCAAEHEMLEQMGEACALRVLVARPDGVEHVDGGQRCVPRLMRQHRQPVG